MIRSFSRIAGLAILVLARPAAAQDDTRPPRNVMIGVGAQAIPSFPGSTSHSVTFLPLVDIWREGEPMAVESPDESFGFTLIGTRRSRFAAGPVATFAPTRDAEDLPGLPKVGLGVEAGIFAEAWPIKPLRLRSELRQGIGGHKALTGDLSADLVWRRGDDGPILTAGPRLRWGSAKYNRAYFGVPSPSPVGSLAAYGPRSGIYAVGAAAGLRLPLGRTFGLYGYLGYDRLTGPAADSPIVAAGSRDQYSAGLALTYRFTL
jgi:outer membrane protein